MAVAVEPLIDAIRARLLADAKLRTQVGARVYHVHVPQDAPLPLIRIQLADTPVIRYFDNSTAHPFTVDVEVMLASSETGQPVVEQLGDIEDRIATVLDRHTYSPVPTGYERMVSFVRLRGVRLEDVDTLRSVTRLTLWATSTT